MAAERAPVKKLYAQDFEWGKTIGEVGLKGAYGEVKLATAKESGVTYAIKVVNKKHVIQQKKVEWVNREKTLLDKLRHPNIVNLFYTFSSPENLHFVMEYCPNGELLDQIRLHKCFSMEVARFRTAELVTAVEFMQSLGIAHRDLKPENILLGPEMRLKIVDFGTAKEYGLDRSSRSKSFVGTAQYLAPELLTGEQSQGLAGDLWALGCMIYQVKDIVDQILEPDEDKRLGYREGGMEELKAHPFFEGIDWDIIHTVVPPPFGPPAPEDMPVWPAGSDKRRSVMRESGSVLTSEDDNDSDLAPYDRMSESEGASSDREDKISAERKQKLDEQKKTIWNQFVGENELITFSGMISKKKRLLAHKRQLVLTDKPRLFYVDPEKMVVRGEVTFCPELQVECKSAKIFTITVPHRVYKMDCVDCNGEEWTEAIKKAKEYLK